MDPVALRLKNLTAVSQARDNIPYTSTGFEQCLVEGAKAFGWEEARKKNPGKGPIVRGVGMAGGTWAAGGGGPPSTAIVRLFADGSVNLNMGASDNGCGTKTVMAMIVSEELGVEVDKVQIEYADTATTQFATASGGSKTIPTESPAVRAAAIDCRNQSHGNGRQRSSGFLLRIYIWRKTKSSRKPDPDKKVAVGSIEEFRQTRVVVGIGYRGPNPKEKPSNLSQPNSARWKSTKGPARSRCFAFSVPTTAAGS